MYVCACVCVCMCVCTCVYVYVYACECMCMCMYVCGVCVCVCACVCVPYMYLNQFLYSLQDIIDPPPPQVGLLHYSLQHVTFARLRKTFSRQQTHKENMVLVFWKNLCS